MKSIKKNIVCLQRIYPYFKEYCESIKNNSDITLLPLKEIENYPYASDQIYIFCQKIPPSILNNKSIHSLLLNTEQATRPDVLKYLEDVFQSGTRIIDYSEENRKAFPWENSYLLPYQFDKREVELFSVSPETAKFDIGFIGAFMTSPRRQHVINELKKAGLRVLILENVWGAERDSMLMMCKILLNIHYHTVYEIYESLRCDRWTFSKMLVISETSKNCQLLDISPLTIFETYEGLVDKTIEVINNHDFYYSHFLKCYYSQIEKIKKERLEKISQLSNIILLNSS